MKIGYQEKHAPTNLTQGFRCSVSMLLRSNSGRSIGRHEFSTNAATGLRGDTSGADERRSPDSSAMHLEETEAKGGDIREIRSCLSRLCKIIHCSESPTFEDMNSSDLNGTYLSNQIFGACLNML